MTTGQLISGQDNVDDVLTGSANDDTVSGGSGDDTLDGGAGTDLLIGGEGNDSYVLDSASDVIQEVADTDANGNVVAFGGTDTVTVNFSGYKLGNWLENLVLSGPAITGEGNDLDNTLTGNALNNTLTGNGGADILDGGAGADTLIGGTGNDTYVIDNAGDVIVENADEGTDSVISSLASTTLSDTLENLQLTGNAVTGTGNAQANALIGTSGNNALYGLGGNDTLVSGGGQDTLYGGTGNDTYYVTGSGANVIENANEGTDTVNTANLYAYTLPSNVENGAMSAAGLANNIWVQHGYTWTLDRLQLSLTGNSGANTLTGSFSADALSGMDGNDTLLGGYGNDTLDGGTGADAMDGGAGDDTYYVDNIGDRVIEKDRSGTDTVYTSVAFSMGTSIENLIAQGTAALTLDGNDSNNLLRGNSANNIIHGGKGNDTLDGGTGADTMDGGLGNDTYYLDSPQDVITELANQGNDTVVTSLAFTLNDNIENLTLTGNASLDLIGTSANNYLIGNDGNNVLDGKGGADTMAGGKGADTYYIDNVNDVIIETQADQSYYGSNLVYLTIGGNFNLGDAYVTWVSAQSGPVHVVSGGYASTYFSGTTGDDYFDVGGGDDNVWASDGNDTLIGGTGYDVLSGGDGQDLFVNDMSQSGEMQIADWGHGADVLNILGVTDKSQLRFQRVSPDSMGEGDTHSYWHADAGQTVMITTPGKTGAIYVDVFQADGSNTNPQGSITVGGALLTFDEIKTAVAPVATSGDDMLFGFSTNDSLAGGDGNDYIAGGGGNDTLLAGNGNDRITGSGLLSGGDGNDDLNGNGTLDGGVGNDYIYTDTGSVASALLGGDGNDYIASNIWGVANVGSTIEGGKGTDTISAAANDTVIYRAGDGSDTVSLNPTAAIRFADLKLSDLLVSQNMSNSGLVIASKQNYQTDQVGLTYFSISGSHGQIQVLAEDGTGYVTLDNATLDTLTRQGNLLPNYLVGTSQADTIHGDGGNDVIQGNNGDDILWGDAGDDWVTGGNGSDTLTGGTGNDYLWDYSGTSVIDGGEGNDTLYASASGANVLTGGAGNDYLYGNGLLDGGTGNDTYSVSLSSANNTTTIVDVDSTAGNQDEADFFANPYELWFHRTNDDLVIRKLDNQASLTVQGWFSGSDHHIETFTAWGESRSMSNVFFRGTLADQQVQGLVTAMASFQPAAGQLEFTDPNVRALIDSAWAVSIDYASGN